MKNYFGGNYGGSISPILFRGKPPVDTYNSLPITGNVENDLRATSDTDHLYIWTIVASSGSLSNWMDIGSTVGNLDTVSDGSTYGRVLLSELTSGQVNRLDDGTNEVEAIDAKDAVDKKHTQGTDLGLDTGGSNPVTAATVKLITDSVKIDPSIKSVAFGYPAGNIPTATGQSTTSIGTEAGTALTSGTNNTFIGRGAGWRVTTGRLNTCVGQGAGTKLVQHIKNTLLGTQAGSLGSGSYNTYVGFAAGRDVTTSSNVLIGNQVGQSLFAAVGGHKLAIDNTDTATPLIQGDFSARTLKINGDLEATGDLTIKVYSQITEPVLDTDNKMAIWTDTDDSNRTFILFRRGTGDQIRVELT